MDHWFWIWWLVTALIAGGTGGLAYEWRRQSKSAKNYRALYLACHEQLAGCMAAERRKAQAAVTERRARLIAFPEQPAPFKQPPWGSTFPCPNRDERSK